MSNSNSENIRHMDNPLVSIILITYNSSQYVQETLESASAQTYQNIELIVTDDCSTDNTVEICKNWIDKNKKRFVRTELITAEKNAGIAPNCNRGLYAAKGEWIKFIAGDDILNNDCIQKMSEFWPNSCSTILFSDIELFGNKANSAKGQSILNWIDRCKKIISTTKEPKQQFKELLNGNFVIAPSVIMKKSTLLNIGSFDEEIKLIEDYPLWIKATKHGYSIDYIDVKLVRYRIEDSSVQTNTRYKVSFTLFQLKYLYNKKIFKIFYRNLDQLKKYNKYNPIVIILDFVIFLYKRKSIR